MLGLEDIAMRCGWALMALALAGCAQAPPGMRYANPNCIFRCVVGVLHVEDAPSLTTLTSTSGGNTGGSVQRTLTETETEVVD